MASDIYRPWSDDENERLIKMYSEKAKPCAMAEALGRSRMAVSAHRLRLQREGRCPSAPNTRLKKHQPWTDEDLGILRKMLLDGSSATSIARALRRVQGEVASKIHSLRGEAEGNA